jgi:hypothetical protein
VQRRRGDRAGTGAVDVDPARQFEHQIGRQPGHRVAVANVDDQLRRAQPVQRLGQRDGHRLVAAGGDVGLVPLVGAQLGEVAAIALVVGRVPQLGRALRFGRRRGVEAGLLGLHVLGPGAAGREHAGQRLARGVVPVEVFVGQRAQRGHQVGAEQPALLGAGQPVGVGQQFREPVPATVPERAQPAEVVDAEVVDLDAAGVEPERGAGPPDESARAVADAEHPRPERAGHHLGDQPGRVRHRDRPGLGRPPRDVLGVGPDDRHAPEGVGQPPGADGLLPEHAQFEGVPLIRHATGRAAGPDGGEDQVGIGQRDVEIGGGAHARVTQDRGDHREPFRDDVVEHQFLHG